MRQSSKYLTGLLIFLLSNVASAGFIHEIFFYVNGKTKHYADFTGSALYGYQTKTGCTFTKEFNLGQFHVLEDEAHGINGQDLKNQIGPGFQCAEFKFVQDTGAIVKDDFQLISQDGNYVTTTPARAELFFEVD